MMLKFKKLRWRNLFSYGNTWTEVQLDRSPSTVITGKNGGGKSAFFEALHINLFGQSIRSLKKAQWVNNKNNKGMETESFFEDGNGDEICVRRCVKPDEFTISRNGVPMNQEASVREMQNILNRDILGSDKVGFQITTLISKSGIQMFMSLKAEERRRFIDNMLGTGVFTEMGKLHKSKNDKLKVEVEAIATKVTRWAALVEGKQSELRSVEALQVDTIKRQKADRQAAVDQLEADIAAAVKELRKHADSTDYDAEYVADIKEAEARLALAEAAEVPEAITKELKDAEFRDSMTGDEIVEVDTDKHLKNKAKLKELGVLLSEMRGRKISLESSLDSLKAGFCQSCKQDVGDEHIAKERAKIAPKVVEIETMVDQATDKQRQLEQRIADTDETMRANDLRMRERKQYEKDLARAKERVEEAQQRIAKARSDAQTALEAAERRFRGAEAAHNEGTRNKQHRVEQLKERLQDAVARLKDESLPRGTQEKINGARDDLARLQAELSEVSAQRDELSEQQAYMAVMTQMLKDGGIKAVIVKKFMPIVNKLVNEKLAELGFFAKFTMDENFEEKILYNGVQEMTFHQFSEGEKLRINLALILAWREIARLQGRMHSNLLMFDETMGESLDDEGYAALDDIFKVLGNVNAFFITHSPDKMENFVRSKIEIVKEAGFSKIKVSNIT